MEELNQDAIYRWPACEKWEYRQIVYTPEGHIDASPHLDFYEAAKSERSTRHPKIEGTAADRMLFVANPIASRAQLAKSRMLHFFNGR